MEELDTSSSSAALSNRLNHDQNMHPVGPNQLVVLRGAELTSAYREQIDIVNNKINEIAGLSRLIERQKTRIRNILGFNNKDATEWFTKTVKDSINNDVDDAEKFWWWVLFNHEGHNDYFLKLSERQLPIIRRLYFGNIEPTKYEGIRNFMKKCIPPTLEELEFMFAGEHIKMASWIEDIDKWVERVTEIFEICNAEFDDQSLSKLLSSCAHLKEVKIWYPKLLITDKFKLDDRQIYFIKELRFFHKKEEEIEGEENAVFEKVNTEDEVMHIIKAFSESKIMRKLETIWFDSFEGVDEEVVRKYLKEYGIDHIQTKVLC